MKRTWGWIYGPTLVYMLVIFILSSIPSLAPPDLGLNWEDKIAHIIEYSIFGILLARSGLLRWTPSGKLFFILFMIGSFYAISDEIHQFFVPNRVASPWDALADIIGTLFGLTIYWNWPGRTKRKTYGSASEKSMEL